MLSWFDKIILTMANLYLLVTYLLAAAFGILDGKVLMPVIQLASMIIILTVSIKLILLPTERKR